MHTYTHLHLAIRLLVAVLVMVGAYSALPTGQAEAAIKWNPGHYLLGDSGTDLAGNLAHFEKLDAETAVKGYVIRLKWGDVETGTTPGNYSAGFAYIDAMLAEAKSQTVPKRIMIVISTREFGDSTNPSSSLAPAYIRTSTYNGGVVKFGNGWTARTWEANVMDRLIAMHRALGARYDRDPYVEMVYSSAETALGWGTEPVPSTYSRQAVRTQLLREVAGMREAWPTTLISAVTNYISGEMETIFAELPGLKAGAGGPDILPTGIYPGITTPPHPNGTEADRVYLGQQGGRVYKGVIPYAGQNQSPVYASKEGSWLPSEIYNRAVNELCQHHVIWVRMWVPKDMSRFNRTDMTATQYITAVQWNTGILPFLRANPTTCTAPVPSAIGPVTSGATPPPTTPSTCTNQQTSTASIPTGFGASYNPLTSAREYLVQASCTGTTQATVTAGNGNPLTYVYNRGYYWTGSTWTPYTLTCASGALISGAWCPGRATASIPLPQNPTNVIAYTCQYTNSTWKCGCRDATCSTAYWQLQRVGR